MPLAAGRKSDTSAAAEQPVASAGLTPAPHDFVVVPPEDYEEALIVKRSLRRAGPNKFRAKKYYAVFLRNNMKKTAVYADWDSVEVLKIKHTGSTLPEDSLDAPVKATSLAAEWASLR